MRCALLPGGIARRESERDTYEGEMFVNEKDLAAALQAGRHDASQWGDDEFPLEPTTKSAKRRLAAMVSARLSPEELTLVQERADALGESVSAYLRRLAVTDIAGGAVANSFVKPSISLSSEGNYVTIKAAPFIKNYGGSQYSLAS
jgi:hypothetical protein